MNPRRLKLLGITRFADPIDLDLTGLPTGLVCLVGPNGAGKTTIMEAMAPAAMFRRFPTRDSRRGLLDVATRRDAYLDAEIEFDGHVWRFLHQLDPEYSNGRGKAEAFLYRDGEPLVAGRLPDFDEAVARLFPPRSVLLASAFAAQGGGGGFVSLPTAERRDLFADLLGLGELQARADRARTHRKALDAADGELGRRRDRLALELERHGELTARLAELRDQEPARSRALEAATAVHATAATRHAELRAAQDGRVELREQAQRRAKAIRDRLEETGIALEGVELTLGELRPALDQAEAIERDHARHVELVNARGEAVAVWREASAALQFAHVERDRLAARVQALEVAEPDADADEAGRALAELVELETTKRAELEAAQALATDHRVPDLIRAELERAQADAGLIDRVPCEGGILRPKDTIGRVDCSACPLLEGATAARAKVPDLVAELDAAEAMALVVANAIAGVQAARGLADQARETVKACEAWALFVEARDALAEATATRDQREAARDEAHAAGAAIKVELDALGDVESRWRQLLDARSRVPMLEARIDELTRERERLAAEQAELVIPEVDEAALGQLEQAAEKVARLLESRDEAQAQLDELRGRIAATRGALDELGDVPAKVAALDEAAQAVGLRRSGFVLLEQALGRDGIQALEIDAAGPEVSELATELLSACYGGRFSCELRTVREAEGARKQREVFDLLVHDGERGGVRAFEDLSGGEQVVVDEALKLAIAVFNARRHGRIRTLWRDEADGKLDPERAAAYPDMLRIALELGGFDRLIYVSHNPVVQAQADARILVDGGRAVVEV